MIIKERKALEQIVIFLNQKNNEDILTMKVMKGLSLDISNQLNRFGCAVGVYTKRCGLFSEYLSVCVLNDTTWPKIDQLRKEGYKRIWSDKSYTYAFLNVNEDRGMYTGFMTYKMDLFIRYEIAHNKTGNFCKPAKTYVVKCSDGVGKYSVRLRADTIKQCVWCNFWVDDDNVIEYVSVKSLADDFYTEGIYGAIDNLCGSKLVTSN